MTCGNHGGTGPARREFLARICGGTAALAAGAMAGFPSALRSGDAPAPAAKLPTIRLGKFEVTRLVAGANPVGGWSHATPDLSADMVEYFTHERTVEFLLRCEQEGINTWQADHFERQVKALQAAREKGSKLQFICLHHEKRPADLKTVIRDTAPIAIVHHGGVTDELFRQGKGDQVRDFVKRVHDLGILAGVSAHNPDNIRRIADAGWENDFFMTCFYQVSRTVEEQRKLLGRALVHEAFIETDPQEMTEVILKVPKPCLGFKILAAGRRCWNPADVEDCFKYAFGRLKRADGVIVGMFPKHRDQIRENAALTSKYGASIPQVGKA